MKSMKLIILLFTVHCSLFTTPSLFTVLAQSKFPFTITLNGTVSDDGQPVPPGQMTTRWTVQSGPAGYTVTFADATAVDTTAVVNMAGVYVFQLTANDGALTTSDNVTVTVTPDQNTRPTVNAGPDQTVQVGQPLDLRGSASDDGLLQAMTYLWSVTQKPSGSRVTMSNNQALVTTATFSKKGTYES
jgi:hypothetical protein